MTTYRSADGHWQVQIVSIDGQQRVRVDHDTFKLGDGHVAPVFFDGTHRAGSLRTPFGYRVAEGTDVAVVTAHIDREAFKTLTEVKSHG